MSEFDEVWRTVCGLEGWMSRGQAMELFNAARRIPAATNIVEIGSHRGRSTILLAKAAPEGTRVFAIDPFIDPRWGGGASSESIFRDNLARAGVADSVEVFRGTSEQALSRINVGRIGLCYIDGAHDLPSVLIDIDGWEPLVATGGAVCIHDGFSSVGVTKAILRRHLLNRRFRYTTSVRSLVVFTRKDLSMIESAASMGRMAARLPYFARNLLVKVSRRRGWTGIQRALGHTDACDPY